MKKEYSLLTKQGFSSVEVLLAIALFSIVILSLAGGLAFSVQSNFETSFQTKASLLAEEGIEAVRAIRNEDFSNLVNGNYGLNFAGNTWQLTGNSDTTEEFTRQIQISDFDANTKQVVSTVTWIKSTGQPGIVSFTTYFTDWQYEVDISGGPNPPPTPTYPAGDWSTIVQSGTLNLSGNNNSSDIWVDGNYMYVLRDSGTEFEVFDITDPINPVQVGSTNSGPSQAWSFTKQGNYMYIVARSNNEEFSVINVTDPSNPFETDSIDLAGNSDGRGLHIEGNYAYVIQSGSNQDLAIIDITDKSNINLVAAEDLISGAEILKIGSYVYIATLNSSNELQVVDVSDPLNPNGVATLNATGSSNCESLRRYAPNKIVMGCNTGRVIFIDITNPASPTEILSYQTLAIDDINQIEVGNDNKYLWLVGDDNAYEVIVLDITDDTAPVHIGSFNTNGDLNGAYYNKFTDILYAAGENNIEEVYIFTPITPAP